MEQKIQRESRIFMEKQFKKYDRKGSGAILTADMGKIVKTLVPNYNTEELEELLAEHAQESSYLVPNKETKEFDIKTEQDTIDFPSAMSIIVHFLKKEERRSSNVFSGKGLVKLSDLPTPNFAESMVRQNKKMF